MPKRKCSPAPMPSSQQKMRVNIFIGYLPLVIPSVVEGPGCEVARLARRHPHRSLDYARDDVAIYSVFSRWSRIFGNTSFTAFLPKMQAMWPEPGIKSREYIGPCTFVSSSYVFSVLD